MALLRLQVEAFGEEESLAFLRTRGVTDPGSAVELLELSQGIPLLLATLAVNPDATHRGGASDTAVDRFLKGLRSDHERQLALEASVPRRLNADVLAVLSGTAAPDDDSLAWLRRLPFVHERRDAWQYHDVVRDLMLAHLRHASPTRWRDAHRRLEEHFAHEGRSSLAETIYHSSARSQPPSEALAHIVGAAAVGAPGAATYARALAQGERDSGRPRGLGSRLADALAKHLAGEPQHLLREYHEILTSDDLGLSPGLKARIHLEIADESLSPEAAFAHIEAAIAIGEYLPLAYITEALAFLDTNDGAGAAESVSRAIDAARESPDVDAEGLARLHVLLAGLRPLPDQLELAQRDVETALEATPRLGIAYLQRAELWASVDDVDEALADFERAAALDESRAHAALHQAAALAARHNDSRTRTLLTRALSHSDECFRCWRLLVSTLAESHPSTEVVSQVDALPVTTEAGKILRLVAYCDVGLREQMESRIDALLAEEIGFSEPWTEKAILEFNRGHFEHVARLAERALDRDSADIRARILHAKVSESLGRLDAAQIDLVTLLERAPEGKQLLLSRGILRWKRGDADGARRDYDTVSYESLWDGEKQLPQRHITLATMLGDSAAVTETSNAYAARRLPVGAAGLELSRTGLWDDALSEFDVEAAGLGSGSDLSSAYNRLVVLSRRGGFAHHGQQLALVKAAIESTPEPAYANYARAGVSALTGEIDSALTCLADAVQRRPECREWAFLDRAFEHLRTDSRFYELLRSPTATCMGGLERISDAADRCAEPHRTPAVEG